MKFKIKLISRIKEAWSLYKNNFLQFTSLSFLAIFLMYIKNIFLKSLLNVFNINGLTAKTIIVSLGIDLILVFIFAFILSILFNLTSSLFKGVVVKFFSKDVLPKNRQFIGLSMIIILFEVLRSIIVILPMIIGRFLVFGEEASVVYMFLIEPMIWLILMFVVIWIFAKLIFSVFIALDKNQSIFTSVKESWVMTSGYVWNFFWRIFLIITIMNVSKRFAGGIWGELDLFTLLLIVLIPVGSIALFGLYKDLSNYKLNNLIPEERKEEGEKGV